MFFFLPARHSTIPFFPVFWSGPPYLSLVAGAASKAVVPFRIQRVPASPPVKETKVSLPTISIRSDPEGAQEPKIGKAPPSRPPPGEARSKYSLSGPRFRSSSSVIPHQSKPSRELYKPPIFLPSPARYLRAAITFLSHRGSPYLSWE